jgi:Ca2+-binding RTX toxin-like protein
VLFGGEGMDTASYANAATGINVSLLTGVGEAGEAADDVLGSIENVIGSDQADSIGGDNGANKLAGGGGNDIFDAAWGNDTVIGGDGSDQIRGGGGDDSLYGGTGLIDYLEGGGGADKLFGGSGQNFATYLLASSGVTLDLGSGGTGGEAAGDTYSSIEGAYGSWFDDTVTGSGNGDTIRGSLGQDVISGGAGNDLLEGEGGNDTIDGGVGSDLIRGGDGLDILTGGDVSDDFFVFDGTSASGVGAGKRDLVTDFSGGGDDRLQFQFDASTSAAGWQTFTFIGKQAFTAEGQIRFGYSGGDTIVRVNTTGTTGAELEVQLEGEIDLSQWDFIFFTA